MKPENITYLYVGAFIDELARSGIQNICLCPGSRSTPLAMMLAAHPAFKLWLHIDERSAAFFALGFAKASHQPVALVCTSGTAAANFLPAVVEAHYARVPLIVLTADRPPELRDIGAAQTIDQVRLYGTHAKWFAEMPLPDASPDLLRFVRMTASRAVAAATESPAGPVHLNFPFREPLVPLPTDELPLESRPDHQPYTAAVRGLRAAEPAQITALAASLRGIERGLIVCGPEYRYDPDFPGAVVALSAALGFPILADVLSNIRCGPHDRQNVLAAYDAYLRDPGIVDRYVPQVVLRFGAIPTSKPLLQYLQRHTDARQIVIDGGGAWNDAITRATDIIHADSQHFCEALTRQLAQGVAHDFVASKRPSAWLDSWRDLDQYAHRAVMSQIAGYTERFEGRVFTELDTILPDGSSLYASSSMPIRDLDTFFYGSERSIRFLSNRGANGIDGVVSSALGASAGIGAGPAAPLVLVIGDLAFYHDMNGLLAAKLHQLNLTVVLVNNDGGGIFSFLPQADYPEHFEQLYGTPTGLDFRHTAALYGGTFTRIEDWGAFRQAVQTAITSEGLKIIEVTTNRERNVTLHRQIWQAVTGALRHVSIS